MRDTFSKLLTGAMVAGAALLVSACGGDKPAADTNTTELNAAEPSMEGSVNDVTAVDAAGASDNMVMDNGVAADNAIVDDAAANATNAM